MNKPLTPQQFRNRMKVISNEGDLEISHGEANYLLCETLSDLGYDAGVQVYEKMEKWYA